MKRIFGVISEELVHWNLGADKAGSLHGEKTLCTDEAGNHHCEKTLGAYEAGNHHGEKTPWADEAGSHHGEKSLGAYEAGSHHGEKTLWAVMGEKMLDADEGMGQKTPYGEDADSSKAGVLA